MYYYTGERTTQLLQQERVKLNISGKLYIYNMYVFFSYQIISYTESKSNEIKASVSYLQMFIKTDSSSTNCVVYIRDSDSVWL